MGTALEQQRDDGWIVELAPAERGDMAALAKSTTHLLRLLRPSLTAASHGLPRPEIATEDAIMVLFDGLLFDQPELRASIRCDSSLTAAEIVLRGYRRWGMRVLTRLNGVFSVLIWTANDSRLLCTRDRAGLAPLFYANHGGHVFLSSSAEALVQDGAVPADPDPQVLAAYLAGRTIANDRTFFAHVRRVPPGHYLLADLARNDVCPYWDPAVDYGTLNLRPREAADAFEELLEKAVGRCVSVGHPGVYLSGLDSAAIAATAAAYARRKNLDLPLALSLLMPREDVREESFQRSAASELGLDQVIRVLHERSGVRGLLAAALRLSMASPAPVMNPFAPGFWDLGRLGVESGCRVLMTGFGGDEWFTNTPRFAADLLVSADWRTFSKLWMAGSAYYSTSRLATLYYLLWLRGIRPIGREFLAGYAPQPLREHRRKKQAEARPEWLLEQPQAAEEAKLELTKRASFDVRGKETLRTSSALSFAHEENYVNGRRVGAHVLQPLWDPELVEFSYKVSPDALLFDRRIKGLLHEAVRRASPQLRTVPYRKMVADIALTRAVWIEAPRLWYTQGSTLALTTLGIVDGRRLDHYMNEVFSKSRDLSFSAGADYAEAELIWRLLSVEAWLRPRIFENGGG